MSEINIFLEEGNIKGNNPANPGNPVSTVHPFKFLDSYTKEDRAIFFGREQELEDIYRKFYKSRILLVYGKSGTGKSSIVNCGLVSRIPPEDILIIHPHDAGIKGIKSGDFVNIYSERGETNMRVEISDIVKPGVIYTTFHFPEAGINFLTSNVGDEYTLTPEYKVVAVDFKKSLYGQFKRPECNNIQRSS